MSDDLANPPVIEAIHEPSLFESIAMKLDGFVNLMTGLGSAMSDKTRNAVHAPCGELNPAYLTSLFNENWLARRGCAAVPGELLRPGYELTCGDPETATAVRMKHDELRTSIRIKEAMTWERVHGGCAVLIAVDDGIEDQSLPVNLNNVRRIDGLTVIERERCSAASYYEGGPKNGKPSHWYIHPVNGNKAGSRVLVHESRLLIFEGGLVTAEERMARNGWGQSVLNIVHQIIADHDMSWTALSHMIQSANLPVWKFKDFLKSMRSSDKMREFFATRMAYTQSTMGVNRGIMLDSDGESFERLPSQFAGIPDSMKVLMLLVSGAFSTPVMVLYGQSPSGLSATGERDMQWWYDSNDVERCEKVKPALEYVTKLIFLSKEGPTSGKEPEEWDLSFPDFVRLTDLEQADLRNKQAQTDALEMQWGVLSPEVVRKSRHRPEGWSWRTQIESADETALKQQQGDPNADPAAKPGEDTEQTVPGQEGAPTDPNAVDPSTALNGAQVKSMQEIVQAVANKDLPRDTGVAMLTAAFPLSPEQAEGIMGSVGRTFFVEKPEPPPAFGAPPKPGQAPPPKPGEEKPEPEEETEPPKPEDV
jgi:phage-related protein (TIGR01555 family)